MRLVKFHVFLLFVVGIPLICERFCEAKVMMEYIGATGVPVRFEAVPIRDKIDFHFILSFAIDADPSGTPQNGKFSSYWAETLTPDAVAAIKKRHPNVKVMVSLAGWSIGDKVLRWYNPEDPQLWISNAFNSLRSMARKYHLDGIDVDYENFPRRSRNQTSFVYCIGKLISRLKKQRVISVATIAPFHTTVKPYIDLFNKHGHVIDHINYQFYTDKIRRPAAYLKTFQLRAMQFDKKKLLPSYEVYGRGIQGGAFFDALGLLKKSGFDINGVMIFSADASDKNNYYFEKKSQALLLNPQLVKCNSTFRTDGFNSKLHV